jgi:vancomycin resistance protein YoaR
MKLKRQKLKHHLQATITGQKGEKLNLVIIEPQTTTCLTAQIQ